MEITGFAAGIVLYNPDIAVLEKEIQSVMEQIDRVYLFDNGSTNIDAIKTLKNCFADKVELLEGGKNYGIAYALNRLMEAAKRDGFQWVLTLDHDSVCPEKLTETYKKYVSEPKAGILCPKVFDKEIVNNVWAAGSGAEIERTNSCIQSGALINIAVWEEVGCFDEWLFIDMVDADFCRKVILNGYYIYRCNAVQLDHALGQRKSTPYRQLAEKLFEITGCKLFKYLTYKNVFSPARIFYSTRNQIVCIKRYKDYDSQSKRWLAFVKSMLRKIIRSENRIMVISQIAKGIAAGLNAKVEPYKIRNKKSNDFKN